MSNLETLSKRRKNRKKVGIFIVRHVLAPQKDFGKPKKEVLN